LVEIAAQFDTTVAAIQEANGLTGSDLRIGQVLNIP
jgi:LysM repeat protein